MDKEKLAHEYALRALSEQISAVEKAYLEGFNEASRLFNPITINNINYFDYGLPSGTLWSLPLTGIDVNFNTVDKKFVFDKVSMLNLPTVEQFEELKNSCSIEAFKNEKIYRTTKGSLISMAGIPTYFWTKSEIDEEYKAIAIDRNWEPIKLHSGHQIRIMLVKNKYSL